MKPINQTLHNFWFESAPATRLALLRILVGLYAICFLMAEHDDYLEVAKTSHRLFAPVGVVFHAPISPDLFAWLLHGTLVAGVCFTLGICFRITGPLFAGMLLWMFCYRNSWSMIYHSDNLVALHTIVLGLTRSADALSLDSLFRYRGGLPGNAAQPLAGWQYGWPIKLICALTVSAYFVTGVAKLCSELGFGWMTGQNLRAQMAVDGIRKELLGSAPNPTAYALYGWLPLFSVLAVGTMIVEFFAPLALLHRRLGILWAVTAFMFHWGILAVMNIKFHYQLWGIMFASFFPLERVMDWSRKSWRPRERDSTNARREPTPSLTPQPSASRATLYYDGECGPCDRFVQFVIRHDRRERFQFATLQSPAGQDQLAQIGLSGSDLKTVVLVEGNQAYVRSTATLRVCRQLSGPWPLLYAFIFVPKGLRDAVYSLFARARKRWFKPPAACSVLPPKWRHRFIS